MSDPDIDEWSSFSASFPAFGAAIVLFVCLRHSNRCVMASLYDFHLHFTNDWWCRTFFMCLFSMYFLFGEMIVHAFAHFIIRLFIVYCWILRVLYRYSSFIRYVRHKYFCHSSVTCLFILSLGSFAEKSFKFWTKSSLSKFPFMDCTFGVKFKNSLTSPLFWRFSPIFIFLKVS